MISRLRSIATAVQTNGKARIAFEVTVLAVGFPVAAAFAFVVNAWLQGPLP